MRTKILNAAIDSCKATLEDIRLELIRVHQVADMYAQCGRSDDQVRMIGRRDMLHWSAHELENRVCLLQRRIFA